MVICIFGESCAGKSSVAGKLAEMMPVSVYSGKDYLKLAKNEADAKNAFAEMLRTSESSSEIIIYIVSEKEQLALLPENALRVLVTAELEAIKERFSKRVNGPLPVPVAAMLERKHGMFDAEPYNLRVDGGNESVEGICGKITALLRG